jgi:iron complex outermembrane receptor protein
MKTVILKHATHASIATLAIAMLVSAPRANAQDNSEQPQATSTEIIVTAQRRAERSVDVPITVTTLGSDQLATANARDLTDIAKITPSLRFDSAAGFTQPTIRGIGTAVVTSGGGGNVGVYIDGFYSPNPLSVNTQLMNVDSVQVLKGPQGTLFGRNTTGGAILIQTSDPSEELAGSFKLNYGRFNQTQAQAYVTGGVTRNIAFDVETMYRYGEGFQTNIVDGNDHIGQYRAWSIRMGLKFQVSEDVSVLLRYQHGYLNDPGPVNQNTYVDPALGAGAPNFAPPGSYTTQPNLTAKDQTGLFVSKSDIFQGTIKADLGFADLASYTQYRKENVNQSQDLDATALPIFQIGIPVEDRTFSQEILLNSKPGGPLQWTAGLFYFTNKDRFLTFIDNFGKFRDPDGPNRLGGSSTTTESYAAFVDATYEVTPGLFLTGGARYAHDAVKDAYYNVGTAQFDVPSISGNKVTPRVVIRYKPDEHSSIYASFTKGYKAAVIDVGGSCQNPPNFACNNVKPEDINAWEVGAKFDDGSLSLEAAGFYYDYKNLQVSSYLSDGRAQIANAASSEIYGLEASMRYRLGSHFELNGGASWTHARYKTFDNAPVYVRCPNPAGCGSGTSFYIPTGTTLENVTMQRTPEFTGNIGARYRTGLAGGEFQVSGNLYYTSKFFFGPSGTQFPQKGYETASARVQWTDPSDVITFAVWCDNLTDKRYLQAVQYNSFGIGANWSPPRTYGIELIGKF